ncbi:hypothetical protein KP509_03G001100 [Ceratopteris richardii]|uniref:Uncharacterized protein n=1 Tax=Ceratopteris richardii TaxID=49495 RepID=A0A8T2V4E1_CERRI|nr:hypothetical protein KP509_03G001100 [Ceratopteris richardii]
MINVDDQRGFLHVSREDKSFIHCVRVQKKRERISRSLSGGSPPSDWEITINSKRNRFLQCLRRRRTEGRFECSLALIMTRGGIGLNCSRRADLCIHRIVRGGSIIKGEQLAHVLVGSSSCRELMDQRRRTTLGGNHRFRRALHVLLHQIEERRP